MPKFQKSSRLIEKVSIARSQVFWILEFAIPQPELENLPDSIRPWLDGDILYGFYADPMPGDEIKIHGYKFVVTKRKFEPTKRNSRDIKVIGRCEVELTFKPFEIPGITDRN